MKFYMLIIFLYVAAVGLSFTVAVDDTVFACAEDTAETLSARCSK
jgi:hypothetical protein